MTLSAPARASSGQNRQNRQDRRLVLILAGALTLLIVLFSLFGPAQDRNDPTPSITNTGTRGAKAVFLLLPQLGYTVRRNDAPLDQLGSLDPSHTTLILTEPVLPVESRKPLQEAIAGFLRRGGRVLATGDSGAELLPSGKAGNSTHVIDALCTTEPEGQGALAAEGKVKMNEPARWSADGPEYRVAQRCGADAVVVSYRYGAGEAVWWSAPDPLTNGGLADDAALRLLLASVGPAAGRTVVFDEYLHTARESLGDTVKGLPLRALGWQLAALGVLLVLSFGRRNGPLRSPVAVPRSSPLEFADSMGRLYRRAGATQAPVEAAAGALTDFLAERGGVSRETIHARPEEIPAALGARFGGDWVGFGEHLTQARAHSGAGEPLSPGSALKLVQALEADRHALEARVAVRVEGPVKDRKGEEISIR